MIQFVGFLLTEERIPPIGWVRQNAGHKKFGPKQSEAAFSAIFSNFNRSRPEAASDVMSGVAVEYVGMDVSINVGDYRSTRSRRSLCDGRTTTTTKDAGGRRS